MAPQILWQPRQNLIRARASQLFPHSALLRISAKCKSVCTVLHCILCPCVCVCVLYLQSCTVGGLFPHRCSRVSCGDRRFPAPDKMSRQLSSDFTNVKNAPNYLPRIFQALVGGEMASTANFTQSFVIHGKVTLQEEVMSNFISF